jgi:hypothetical protein
MKNKYCVLLLIPSIILTFFSHSSASVESQLISTLRMKNTPIDVAVSFSGRWIFVLAPNGKIDIYSGDGEFNDSITVDKAINGIQVSLSDDIIFLTSRENKTFQVLALDFVQDIDISGSPFKGPADAPVVLAVFDDFE